MRKLTAILLSGGLGKRVGRDVPKQHLLLHGKPMIIHSLEKMNSVASIDQIIVTCPAGYLEATERIISRYNLDKKMVCIEGGATRQESVYLALEVANSSSVLLHEAARPFVSVGEFGSLAHSAFPHVTYAIPVPFTVLQGGTYITGLLDRANLLNIQLPQKFVRDDLLKCHQIARSAGDTFTEDAGMIVHYLGGPVHVLKGSELNIKITTPYDLVIGDLICSGYFSRQVQ